MKIISGLLVALVLVWGITYYRVNNETHEYAAVSTAQREAAQTYLQGKLTAPHSDWQWVEFEAAPGVILRGGKLKHENAKGTVMVVPGFTGSIEMTLREINQIHAAGFSVAAVEYRGQGKSYRPLNNPEKGYVEDYKLLAKEVLSFARTHQEPNKPLFFYSISKGAHITMRMAAELEPDIAAYALMVPMIKINTGTLGYETVRTLATVLQTLGLGKMYAPGQGAYTPEEYNVATPCNGNPDTAQSQGAMFALNPELRTRGSTVKWLYETFRSSDLLLDPKYSRNISAPVLLFTAGIDHLVDSDAAQQFCDGLPNCKLTHVEQARHCITRENFAVYDGLVDQAITHFNAQL